MNKKTKKAITNKKRFVMKKLLSIASIPMIITSCLNSPIEDTAKEQNSIKIDNVISKGYDTTYAVQEFYSTDTLFSQRYDTAFVIDTINIIDSWSMKTEIYDLDTIISTSIDTITVTKLCTQKHRAVINLNTKEVLRDSKLAKCESI